MLGYVGNLGLTSRLSHQMSVAHLTKGQIKMVNLTKPYPFNMAILIDICPFWPNIQINTWLKRSFLSNVLVKCNMCFSWPKILVKMEIPFGQCEHFNQVSLLKHHDFLWWELVHIGFGCYHVYCVTFCMRCWHNKNAQFACFARLTCIII